jgi:hypothetical protein
MSKIAEKSESTAIAQAKASFDLLREQLKLLPPELAEDMTRQMVNSLKDLAAELRKSGSERPRSFNEFFGY